MRLLTVVRSKVIGRVSMKHWQVLHSSLILQVDNLFGYPIISSVQGTHDFLKCLSFGKNQRKLRVWKGCSEKGFGKVVVNNCYPPSTSLGWTQKSHLPRPEKWRKAKTSQRHTIRSTAKPTIVSVLTRGKDINIRKAEWCKSPAMRLSNGCVSVVYLPGLH